MSRSISSLFIAAAGRSIQRLGADFRHAFAAV
jgi:hypothetical protein